MLSKISFRKPPSWTRFGLLGFLLLLAGCGSNSTYTGDHTNKNDYALSITPATPIVTAGHTVQLTGKSPWGSGAVWSVLPASAGAIDSTGRFTAGSAPTTATIVAMWKDDVRYTATAPATIVAPPVATVTVPSSTLTRNTAEAATVPTQPNSTYAWTIQGGTLVSGQGTPQVQFTSTDLGSVQLTCTVTNAAGDSASGQTTVTILDVPPSIQYAPAYTLTRGVPAAPILPASTGGAVVTWSISPGPPAGLSFNAANGQITGTSTSLQSATPFTVTATNTGGSTSAIFTLATVDTVPAIAYNPASFVFTRGSPIPPVVPTSSGGAISSWSIVPALPTGLSFNTATGTISGSPSQLSSSTRYTVTGTNTGGSATATLALAVVDPVPAIQYATTTQTLVRGVALTPLLPSNTGGTAVTWQISPGLPAGLTFDPATGTISGTPTTPASAATFTVTATNTGGTSNAVVLTLAVVDSAPVFACHSNRPTSRPSTRPSRPSRPPSRTGPPRPGASPRRSRQVWRSTPPPAASPALPPSLSPAVLVHRHRRQQLRLQHHLHGLHHGHRHTAGDPLHPVRVQPYQRCAGRHDPPHQHRRNCPLLGPSVPAFPPASPSTPQPATSSGTPTTLTAAAAYAVTATNTGGTSNPVSLSFAVVDVIPTIGYSPSVFVFTRGQAISPVLPANSGGSATSWTISPGLPRGPSPSTPHPAASQARPPPSTPPQPTPSPPPTPAASARHSQLTLSVVDIVPVIAYSSPTLTVSVGSPIPALVPTNSGGPATSWSLHPALPAGPHLRPCNRRNHRHTDEPARANNLQHRRDQHRRHQSALRPHPQPRRRSHRRHHGVHAHPALRRDRRAHAHLRRRHLRLRWHGARCRGCDSIADQPVLPSRPQPSPLRRPSGSAPPTPPAPLPTPPSWSRHRPSLSVRSTPASPTRTSGTATTFSAVASGGVTNALTWTASAGTIDPNTGAWAAPTVAGPRHHHGYLQRRPFQVRVHHRLSRHQHHRNPRRIHHDAPLRCFCHVDAHPSPAPSVPPSERHTAAAIFPPPQHQAPAFRHPPLRRPTTSSGFIRPTPPGTRPTRPFWSHRRPLS